MNFVLEICTDQEQEETIKEKERKEKATAGCISTCHKLYFLDTSFVSISKITCPRASALVVSQFLIALLSSCSYFVILSSLSCLCIVCFSVCFFSCFVLAIANCPMSFCYVLLFLVFPRIYFPVFFLCDICPVTFSLVYYLSFSVFNCPIKGTSHLETYFV